MKAFSQIFVTIGFVTLMIVNSNAQPCLHLNSEPNSPCITPGTAVTTGSNAVSFRMVPFDADLDMDVPAGVEPRYKAFWIFGDGNFRHFPSNLEYADDIATLSQDYGFPPAYATYKTRVVLTEKKSNTSPPPDGDRPVEVQPPNSKIPGWLPGSGFVTRLDAGETMDIFNSDLNRPEYPTAFVVSAPKADLRISGMFFFFNNARFGSTGSFGGTTIHDPTTGFSINLPNYFGTQTTTVKNLGVLNAPPYLSGFSASLRNYENFIDVAVPDSIRGDIPGDFSEIRFFPVLKSVWDNNWVGDRDGDTKPDTLLPTGRYLAISVGPEPLYSKDSPDSPGKTAFITEVSTHFDGLSAPEFQISTDPALYIRGIKSFDVEMVASIDPNGIQILKICPLDKDKYQVTLKLEVCNEGYMHESDFTFQLTDHSNLLSAPNFMGDPEIVFLGEPAVNTWKYMWDTYLEAVPYPYGGVDPAKLEKPDNLCAQSVFMVETNWEGAQALIDGKALELCVRFKYGPEKCTMNSPLSSREYCREAGYDCGECPKSVVPKDCCNWIFYGLVLLFLILFILIWILWALMKRKNHHKH